MDFSNVTILIGDDSILARKQLIDIIQEYATGATFVQAKDGEDAIQKYNETHPTLVFLDIVMPIKDGISAVKGIMENDPEADIVIVSSVGTQAQLRAAIDAGAKDFIQKPIRKDQVLHVVKSHLGGN